MPIEPAFTTPVVDYEPPPTRVDAVHRPTVAARRRPDSHRRTPRTPTGDPAVPAAAHAFADAALRSVLEVLDRRRPVAQLRPLMPIVMVDVVESATRSTREVRATAVLRRVRLQPAGRHTTTANAAEVFASYTRGQRVGAIAGRVELVPGGTGPRWQLVALHLG